MKATVFDIKEFAIYDGPGVRQTVFFKGCPLSCAWCHNPEGLRSVPELGVSLASCLHCGKCARVCPSQSFDNTYMRALDCTLCQKCIDVCPLGLRRVLGREYTVDELARRILSKADYYACYGGGVTFSGGEPMLQSDFLLALCDALGGVHKAVETSGFVDPKAFAALIRKLDYVIMDIKCIDDEKHRRFVGASNRVILENYTYLRGSGVPHTVRIPLIGTVSDDRENLEASAALLAGDEHLERVELLPYQVTAGAKYKSVAREYTLDFDPEPRRKGLEGIFEKHGIRSVIL